MDKKQVGAVLDEMGTLLELKGENPFKVRAFQNAARTILSVEANLAELAREKKLTEIKGVGAGIAEIISDLVLSGRSAEYEKLEKSFPAGLLELLAIQGLGPKKAKVLYERLHIKSVADLEKACRANRLLKLEGFGAKTQENILKGIAYMKGHSGQHLYSEAIGPARELLEMLLDLRDVTRASIAGSLRRHKEVIKDIDIITSSRYAKKLGDLFVKFPQVESVTGHGETKCSVRLKAGLNCDLRIVSDEEYPYALHHFTGSKEHNIAMRSRAQDQFGIKVSEWGLFKGKRLFRCKDEDEIYEALKLAYVPPEMREDMGEMEMAENGTLPALVEEKDLQGIFHTHTTWSDGTASIKEMALAAKKAGFKYIGLSDHSQAAAYAKGIKEKDLPKYWAEIDAVNKQIDGIKILKGTEMDILGDGSPDYSDKALEKFDFVIASVHSRFQMTEDEMTKRIIKTMSHPKVTMLGHPTGRLLLEREAYPVNMKKIIESAKKHNVVIEINANPHRFDIDWRLGPLLRENGVKVSINPDAHTTDGILDTFYGVGIARKAGLTKSDVINTAPLSRFPGK